MNRLEKHAGFYRGYLTDDRSLVPGHGRLELQPYCPQPTSAGAGALHQVNNARSDQPRQRRRSSPPAHAFWHWAVRSVKSEAVLETTAGGSSGVVSAARSSEPWPGLSRPSTPKRCKIDNWLGHPTKILLETPAIHNESGARSRNLLRKIGIHGRLGFMSAPDRDFGSRPAVRRHRREQRHCNMSCCSLKRREKDFAVERP
jgi:hypothetical protein